MKKPLFFCTGFVVLATVVLLFTGGMEEPFPLRPLYRLEEADQNVLLTFNVLWGSEAELQEVLAFVESHNLEAVFFVTGDWVKTYPHVANNILQSRQYLGNHTLSYPNLTLLGEEGIHTEIKGCNDVFAELLDYTPFFFRPPYGECNSRIVRIAKEVHCVTLLWSVNAHTTTNREPGLIIGHLEEHLHPGAIILMHLTPVAARVLPALVDFLAWKGYTISSPQQLLN